MIRQVYDRGNDCYAVDRVIQGNDNKPSMMSYRFSFNTAILVGCAPFMSLLVGCDSDKGIKVYQVPKEKSSTTAPAMGGADPHAGVNMPKPGAADPHAGMDMPGGVAKDPSVVGEVPESWQPGRVSSMRLASYALKTDDGAAADISLISLAGTAGGVLDNINRWRGQVGLGSLTE